MAFGLTPLSRNRNPYGPPAPDYKRLFLFGGLGFIGLVIILILSVTVFADHSKANFMVTIGRLQFLSTTINSSQKRVHDDNLAKVNSDASLLIASDVAALQAQLKLKFDQNNIDPDVLQAETDTTVPGALSNAELLDKFDTTYRSILIEKIDALIFSIPNVRDSMSGSDFKAAMDKTVVDLKTVENQLNQLSLQ